ncbi:MAG: 6-phosphogluconate dehydrogenase [Candidatus Peregrinibacteria bacterium Greene0416_19]|nr:MAG: 6-phosphogluconate dehydrogenase [Candidatus Peregrinibacteria bacterium Greene0416_19]
MPKTPATAKFQLGVIGLGTMGANLARNAARNGARVAVCNRSPEKTDAFMQSHGTEGKFVACASLKDLRKALKVPRAILLMVKAGEAVDIVIQELLPLLDQGDILIDGGNSHFRDTERRQRELREKGIRFVGMGVSGGEEGALNGPSMMPGGDQDAFAHVEILLKRMAADDGAGGRCVTYLGSGSSGHFVKMVHNGIEYGVMQLIAECYQLLKEVGGSTNDEMSQMFAQWNEGDLQSFLLLITAQILQKKDPDTGEYLVDLIKDAAGQKGTGKWTTEAAMDLGIGIPTITAAVDARILSLDPAGRREQNGLWPESLPEPYPETKSIADLAQSAFRLSVICTYAQGFELLKSASDAHKWDLPYAEIARIWRGGCIIRSALLPRFQSVFSGTEDERKSARHALVDLYRGESQVDWRHLIAIAIGRGIPVPALMSSLTYYDTLRAPRLPQNLIQAQRDCFGAHTFERTDREGAFHADWKN